MPEHITLPSDAPLDTQTALEYYGTDFRTIMHRTLATLTSRRMLLFSPEPQWFDVLATTVERTLPPTVSPELLETAKWTVIDDFVPSEVKDSREERLDATVMVITQFMDSFAKAHHQAVPSSDFDENGNATLDHWLDE